MSEALATPQPVEFGPEQMTLGTELLRVLTAGDVTRLKDLLRSEDRPGADGHVAIEVNGASQGAASSPVGTGCLLGVTSNRNTALHLVASRGHAELAALVCERAPSLVATRNAGLDTPLHCAAKAGSRGVAACLLSQMRAAGEADAAAALRAWNLLGATALHEAVRLSRAAVVELLMAEAPELASVTTEDGVSALYLAAEVRSEEMVRLLLRSSTDGTPSPTSFSGRHGQTALHAAATVSKGITNKDGLSVQDLADRAVSPSRWRYFLDPHFIILHCLCCLGIGITLDRRQPLHYGDPNPTEEVSDDKEEHDMLRNGAIGSVLIATVAFAAAFTVPGGLVAGDDHRSAGTAILARRFAFRAFVVSDTLAFLCSIVATSFLIHGGARENLRSHRIWYKILASRLMPMAARFMIAAFAFGFHLVLGGDANRGLIVFVYVVSLAPVLFCFPDVWIPLLLLGMAKAIWRRAGWTGLVNMNERPMSLLHLVKLLVSSFMCQYLVGTLVAVLIATTFAAAIALSISLPNY
nr:unnamed protein product [Digitaria exilis]